MPDDSLPNVTGNGGGFHWTGVRQRAASLLADDELTDNEIAAQCGVTRQTLARWKLVPVFAARVAELSREMGDAASRYAVSRRVRRLRGYDERRDKLLAVVEERGADPSMQGIPGGQTGLLVRTVKSIGGGDNAQVVEEYTVDTGLLKELRELEKQAAQEAGQWIDKREFSGSIELRPVTTIEVILPSEPAESSHHAGNGTAHAHG